MVTFSLLITAVQQQQELHSGYLLTAVDGSKNSCERIEVKCHKNSSHNRDIFRIYSLVNLLIKWNGHNIKHKTQHKFFSPGE